MLIAKTLLIGVLLLGAEFQKTIASSMSSSPGPMIPSPCPAVFQYRFDGDQWQGEVSLRRPQSPGVVHLKVILSLRGRPPTDYIGEIQLINCGVAVLQSNCSSSSAKLFYKVKFPRSRVSVPRISQILVNGRVVCLGPGDRGILVTLIQLEHIRSSTFVADDGSTAAPVREDDHLENVTRIGYTCGRASVPPLASGQFIARGSWPWLAAVYVHNLTTLEFRCGATLISRRLVLGAAHCFHTRKKRYSPAEMVVTLGRWDLATWTEKGSLFAGCQEIHIHPDYDETGASYDADIAVILLDEVVLVTEQIRPVCLWPKGEDLLLDKILGNRGFVVGWGHDRAHPLRPTPKKSSGIIVSRAACIKSNKKFEAITSWRTFCAGDRNGSGPCSGDSGMGFIMQRNQRWTLRGIVSASLPPTADAADRDFCNLNEFIVYTDTAQFLDWIYIFLDTYG